MQLIPPALVLAAAAIPGSARATAFQELDRASIEAIVAPVMEERSIPGAVVGIVVGDDLVVREAFGLRDVESETPMTPDVLFQVGSVTKPFTATLLGLLVADGRVGFEDTLGERLGAEVALPAPLRAITLRQLATHSAGLPRNPVNRRDLPDSPGVMLPYSVEELYAGLARTELESAPGERWAYSNLGYAILGRVLEVAAGEPYEQLVLERIAAPLELSSTFVSIDGTRRGRLASCYWPEDDEPIARAPWEFGEVAAFGGLVSSVDDLSRFVSAQYDADGAIAADVLAPLHAPVIDVDPARGRAMAPGWFVDRFPGVGEVLGHGGEVDGHSACVAFLPRARAGLVVLANIGGDAAERLSIALMREALPVLLRR